MPWTLFFRVKRRLPRHRRGKTPRVQEINAALPAGTPESLTLGERMPEKLRSSPAAVAYAAIAEELPGVTPESIEKVYRSKKDPSWASVYVGVPDEENPYILFLQEKEGELGGPRAPFWPTSPTTPRTRRRYWRTLPKDLVEPVYIPDRAPVLGLSEEPAEMEGMPAANPPEFSEPELTFSGVPAERREKIKGELEEAQKAVEDFEGVAGYYVHDLEGDWGYGARPDQVFYSASDHQGADNGRRLPEGGAGRAIPLRLLQNRAGGLGRRGRLDAMG